MEKVFDFYPSATLNARRRCLTHGVGLSQGLAPLWSATATSGSHSGFQDAAAAAASPFLTNQHTESSLSSTSSAVSFNHCVNTLEYTTCRCVLVTTKSNFRAGVSPSPDAHRYSTSCLLFQKNVLLLILPCFLFFFSLLPISELL